MQDLGNGENERAENRMNDGDGGLAKHAVSCPNEIDWENAKIVGKETGWTQRIFLEGIETLRRKDEHLSMHTTRWNNGSPFCIPFSTPAFDVKSKTLQGKRQLHKNSL